MSQESGSRRRAGRGCTRTTGRQSHWRGKQVGRTRAHRSGGAWTSAATPLIEVMGRRASGRPPATGSDRPGPGQLGQVPERRVEICVRRPDRGDGCGHQEVSSRLREAGGRQGPVLEDPECWVCPCTPGATTCWRSPGIDRARRARRATPRAAQLPTSTAVCFFHYHASLSYALTSAREPAGGGEGTGARQAWAGSRLRAPVRCERGFRTALDVPRRRRCEALFGLFAAGRSIGCRLACWPISTRIGTSWRGCRSARPPCTRPS